MSQLIIRRVIGIVLILCGLILFLLFPPGFHHWGYAAFITSLLLGSIGWRVFGRSQREEELPKQSLGERVRKLNMPLFLCGVGLVIVAVVYAYLVEKLALPKENNTAAFVLFVLSIGLMLISAIRS